MVSKWTFLFQGLIFRFHVKFRGCRSWLLTLFSTTDPPILGREDKRGNSFSKARWSLSFFAVMFGHLRDWLAASVSEVQQENDVLSTQKGTKLYGCFELFLQVVVFIYYVEWHLNLVFTCYYATVDLYSWTDNILIVILLYLWNSLYTHQNCCTVANMWFCMYYLHLSSLFTSTCLHTSK